MISKEVECPGCGKSITPVEKVVFTRNNLDSDKRKKRWLLVVMGGLLIIVIGIVVYLYYGLSSVGLSGLGVSIVDVVIIGIFVVQQRKLRKKQLYLICPECKHRWVKTNAEINGPDALESYFTNVEQLRAEFDRLLVAPALNRRLLIIHGVGGVGKSSLLRMFRLQSRKKDIPVALSLGDEAKSAVDVLSNWAKDLLDQGITLPSFARVLNEYHSLQKKVEERAKSEDKHAGTASKTAIKVAMQATSSIAGNIPIVGIPLSIVMGSASDTLVDWLHNFLTQPQIELLLDPTDELTETFLQDLQALSLPENKSGTGKRIVLLLDTFEQVMALYRWVGELAQKLPPSVLLVLAGHGVPRWDQQWPGWTTQAYIEELKPMTEEVMRELVHRYYATQRGGTPDESQVEAIIRFARGLPIAVTTVVQLWIQYGVEDFHAVRPQVLADLVDQLTRGVPERVRPILKAAATLRWFNEELLRMVTAEPSMGDDIYEELRRFPFVRSRAEGLALHDAVREHLDDNLRVHEPARHREFHQRAAAYFEDLFKTAQGEDATKIALEILYHQVVGNEVEGIKNFRKTAEELVRYQLPHQLNTLLNDISNYPLQRESSRLWRSYYQARLKDLEGHPYEAVQVYQAIAENLEAEEALRIYASCDWAWVARLTSLGNMEQILDRTRVLIPELESLAEPDAKIGSYFFELVDLYKRRGQWLEVLTNIERARKLYERIGDIYGMASATIRLEYYYLDRGMWKEGFEMQQKGLQEITQLVGEQQQSYLKAEFLGTYALSWVWAGCYHEMEARLREALHIAERFGRIRHHIIFSRDLGLTLGLQGKLQEAEEYFNSGDKLGSEQNPMDDVFLHAFKGMVALRWISVEEAEQYLTICIKKLAEVERKEWFMPGFLNLNGILYEIKGSLDVAEEFYQEILKRRKLELWYQHASALTGLARIYAITKNDAALKSVLLEAEELAQQYEYNDHLASLHLIQGHLCWEEARGDKVPNYEKLLHHYQQAMIYALRYNRFLLDDLLGGRPQGTPFEPVILSCLKRKTQGERVLRSLHSWWQQGKNTVDKPRQISISPFTEGIALLEAESLARLREPGDGTAQATVLEQLERALAIYPES